MTFGIREKISLLVFLATVVVAVLVAQGVARKSQQVLREHELVDLGDEALLRGWTLSDKVDGLAEDLMSLAFSQEFHHAAITGSVTEELARKFCRRYWNDYLLIDVVSFEGDDPFFKVVHQPVELKETDRWMPPAEVAAGRLQFSLIERIEVKFPGEDGAPDRVRSIPVIWGLVPFNRNSSIANGPQHYIRIATSLAEGASVRQFYVLEDQYGNQLQRPDEFVPEGEGNDAVFKKLSEDKVLLERMENQLAVSADVQQHRPRVQRLVKRENEALTVPYYFQEGVVGDELLNAIEFQDDTVFLTKLQRECESIGRVGGMRSGVKELRLLARSPENLRELKEKATSLLKERFGDQYDGVKWRQAVECDEIHSWAVQLLIGVGDNLDRYLIHYAVMEDELASSINHEMRTLRRNAIFIAGGAGILAFLMAMLFIRPLKSMTQTAQQITESGEENLHEQLRGMINQLAIRRRDEVGEISRASKRLFEEVIASQEELEQRVADRTIDLRKTNFELEQANLQLKSLSQEKDAFVAKVSHDLRQPLNAIFLQVEALKLSELDDLQKSDVQKIHDHATRELNLVNDILEYQKIIMGAETLVRDEIDIESFMADLHSNYLHNAESKGLELKLDCPAKIGKMTADERRLRQVLGNLTGNACKFTGEGSVAISVEPRTVKGEDWIEFSVADTGRGMSPEEQSKAFVPFVSNKKDNAGGTGLGLSICKELTERMGGRIGFISELGSGTNFSVLIPREAGSENYEAKEESDPEAKFQPPKPELASSAQEAAKQIALHAGGGLPGGGKGARVLVIDDDESVRVLLKRLLEGDGYEVLTAENGEEGLERARKEKPDVVTLDVVMPGELDGWAVLKELKADSDTEGIPVIMVSIMAEADNGFALDVEDYLVKPVDLERLSRVVSRATKSAHQRNLLIVDDEVDSREALGRILSESGWKCVFASHGKEALEVLERTLPAAIVLDLMMPEMDGFEFLKIVQEDGRLASIPVIVMTGKEPTAAERKFLEKRVGMILKKDKEDSGSRRVLQTITQRIRPHGESKL